MKRFYKTADVGSADIGWRVLLDGRPVRTAGGRPQILPTRPLAEALAGEWAAQGEVVDASGFILRDLADYAIDVVAADPDSAIAAILPYAETDTLCYRAEAGEVLRPRQDQAWEPLLVAAERRYDIHFERIGGIMHRPQPAATIERLHATLKSQDAFTLAALQTMASLAASIVLALAALEPDAEAEALWNTANLEEDWQAEFWGRDAEAQARRERRLAAFAAAMQFARLCR